MTDFPTRFPGHAKSQGFLEAEAAEERVVGEPGPWGFSVAWSYVNRGVVYRDE